MPNGARIHDPTDSGDGGVTTLSRLRNRRGRPRACTSALSWVAATTAEIRERFYAGVPLTRDLGRRETFYSIEQGRRLLGFAPEHSWREVLADPGARGGGPD